MTDAPFPWVAFTLFAVLTLCSVMLYQIAKGTEVDVKYSDRRLFTYVGSVIAGVVALFMCAALITTNFHAFLHA